MADKLSYTRLPWNPQNTWIKSWIITFFVKGELKIYFDFLLIFLVDIVGCSALNGEGLYEGLDWLAGELGNQATKKAISSAVQTSIDDAAKTVGGKKVKSGRSLLWEPILSIKKWLFPQN